MVKTEKDQEFAVQKKFPVIPEEKRGFSDILL